MSRIFGRQGVPRWARNSFPAGPLGGGSGHYHVELSRSLSLIPTPFRKFALLCFLVVAGLVPTILDTSQVRIAVAVEIGILGALGLNLVVGIAGQLSLAAAAFMAVGAFTAGILSSSYNVPFILVLGASVVAGALMGAVVALPAIRLRGLYLVLATLGFHYVVWFVTHDYEAGRGAAALSGIIPKVPTLGEFAWTTPEHWYYTIFAFDILATLVFLNLQRSRFGRAWVAIRERDLVAQSMGVSVARGKILVFMISSGMLALAGTLFSYSIRVVTSEYFSLTLAIQFIAMVVAGGLGSVLGSWLGAMFIVGMPYLIQYLFTVAGASARVQIAYIFPIQLIVFGIVVIAFLLVEPAGLTGLWIRIRNYFRLWPLRRTSSR